MEDVTNIAKSFQETSKRLPKNVRFDFRYIIITSKWKNSAIPNCGF